MSDAERKRLQRQRERAGMIVVPVEVEEVPVLDMLRDQRLLHPADQDDPKAVARALAVAVTALASLPREAVAGAILVALNTETIPA